jgi:hypothetical protein
VPALPSSILEPLWVQVAALLPTRQVYHPLGCHRPRIPDRIIFDKLLQVLVFGCGYRRIADQTCSATTLRRRRDEWIALGLADRLRCAVLGAYDRLFGLELEHLAVDSCTTKAPVAARSPGPARLTAASRACSVRSWPTRVASRWGRCRLRPTVATTGCWRPRWTPRSWSGAAPAAGGAPGRRLRLPALPAGPERAGHGRRDRHAGHPGTDPGRPPVVIERTHAWGNQYGKLRWCTERRRLVVEFWLALAGAAVVCGRIVRRAWTCYRWDDRPRRRP